jgi:dienelactone hydrolase
MFLEFAQVWANDPAVTSLMTADWRATIDAVQDLPEVGRGAVGWWGLSMGTIFGLPVVASDERVSAAVLGCMGTGGPSDAVRDQVVADARAIECPVLFLMQWNDQIFSRAACLDLFDTLGSASKRLHVQPGGHADVPAEELDASESFLAELLGAAAARAARATSVRVGP